MDIIKSISILMLYFGTKDQNKREREEKKQSGTHSIENILK